MKKLIISGVFCSVLMLGGFQVASAEETTTTAVKSQAEMLAQIEQLMKLIADLQEKINIAKGDIKELMSDLSIGATGDDVLKAQELLASDPSIFGVKPTGYFGPITEAAIKKFQEQYGLPVTGLLDEATREVMKELRKERKDGHVPPGFIKSAEMHDKIKARLQAKWGDCIWGEKFRASDCQKGHDDKDDSDEEDDDDNASTTRAEAKAAIEEAEDAVAGLEADIEEMEDDNADQDDIKDAEEMLEEAEEELAEAKEAFDDEEYEDAEEAAEEVLEIINGEDEDEDEDEDDDDEDDDDEDDEDDDEDDDD